MTSQFFAAFHMRIDSQYEDDTISGHPINFILVSYTLKGNSKHFITMTKEKPNTVYWTVDISKPLNLSHFVPAIKIGNLLDSGKHAIIILGDLHDLLLHNSSSSILEAKCQYYTQILKLMISSVCKTNLNNLQILKGSQFQLSKEYMLDFYLLAGSTPVNCDNSKASNNKSLGSLAYPLMRIVDDKYAKADDQLTPDSDLEYLCFTEGPCKRISHKPCAQIVYPVIHGLSGKPQLEDDQVLITETPKQVKKRLSKAFCEPGNVEVNGVLPILRHITFPVFQELDISRPVEYGGDVKYYTVEDVVKDFVELKLHPGDLKKGLESLTNKLLEKVQTEFQASKELQDITLKAFPLKKDKKPQAVAPTRVSSLMKNLALNSDGSQSKVSYEEKIQVTTRGLQEVLQRDTLETLLKDRNVRIYWGTATTGRPHLAYFVPMAKIADFLRADCEVTILLADLHGYLDSQKAPWQLLDARTSYYQNIIVSMLKSIDVPIEKLKFIRGTDYELERDFSLDFFKLISQTSLHDAKKAGAEVVKQTANPLIGSLFYPLLQALDEEYLNCDAQFGGVDQRKIFIYAEKYLPQIGYVKRIHLMNPMVPGLSGGKMSSSEIDSKIDLLDDAESVIEKLSRASCEAGDQSENGVLAFIKQVIWPLFNNFSLESSESKKEYQLYDELARDFTDGKISEETVKLSAASYINRLLGPIREDFQSQNLKELTKAAYPNP